MKELLTFIKFQFVKVSLQLIIYPNIQKFKTTIVKLKSAIFKIKLII